jgi:hypothetical protein
VSTIPSGLPSAPGAKSKISIFGHQVSTDAVLIAAASLVAVIFLYRAGKPSTAAPLQPLSLSGDGSTLATPSNPLIASSPPPAAPGTVGATFGGNPPTATPGQFAQGALTWLTDPGGLQIPIASTPGGAPLAWLSPGTQVHLAGSPVVANWGGKSFLTEQVDYLGSKYWVNVANLPNAAGM